MWNAYTNVLVLWYKILGIWQMRWNSLCCLCRHLLSDPAVDTYCLYMCCLSHFLYSTDYCFWFLSIGVSGRQMAVGFLHGTSTAYFACYDLLVVSRGGLCLYVSWSQDGLDLAFACILDLAFRCILITVSEIRQLQPLELHYLNLSSSLQRFQPGTY
jgi:hypothetical protein